MINRRIMTSLIVLGIVGALAGGSTWALLNDTETSDTNTFQAGPMELDVEMERSMNGEALGENEIAEGQPFVRMDDVKPGDVAEEEVDVGVEGNPAFVEMRLNQTEDAENSCTEPEAEAEGGECDGEGDLRENTHLTVWNDENENGEIDDGEEVMLENPSENAEQLEEGMMIDADPSTEEIEPFQDESETIMYRWEVPRSLGNEAQTDSFAYELQLRAEQARHNGPENAADWYQVTGEDAGEPVDNGTESEDENATDEPEEDSEPQESDDSDNNSDSADEDSSDTSGFSDDEDSETNEFQADSETDNESEDDSLQSNTQNEDTEEQEEDNGTTEDTSQEENDPSEGQVTAGLTGAAGLLLVLFAAAGALYRKRL